MVANMTNSKNNSLFNADLKGRYLESVSDKTRGSYNRIFLITSNYENALGRDINSFDLKEIESVLRSFKSKTRNTIESYGRIISAYLNWCVKNGIIPENVMEDMKPDDFEKFVYNDSEYINEKQLRRFEDFCNNYQDAVLLRLLFIGVGGKKLSEIRNLKVEDVNFESKKLRLTNTLKEDENGLPLKYTERIIDVDDRTLALIDGAINQDVYLKKNGEIAQTENNNISPYTDLVSSDYVVRASITKTDSYNEPVDKFVIYRRLSMLGEVFGVEKFNAKFIQQSGMLYLASNLIEEKDVSLDDLKIIADTFNIKSYHNLKGLITIQNIKKLYKKGE